MDQEKTPVGFSIVIDTAGTEERLVTAPLVVDEITITCDQNNTGDGVVGSSNVAISATKGLTIGDRLVAGQSRTFKKIDLSKLYFDVANNGDAFHGVYTY